MSRISFQRNTPEGWQSTIQRMASLNGLKIDPQTARQVVKYLSNSHGLAPEEAKPAAFEAERRLIDYKYTANADAESVCTKCHSMGRVISQRRTKSEWDLLIAMHRGWYPLVDNQAFRRNGPPPRDPSPDGRPPDLRQPVEKALDHLSKTFPLKTPEWQAWSANMRPARLDGTWALSGWELGKGAIYGKVTIAADSGSPTSSRRRFPIASRAPARSVSRTGRGIVYTGFQWRGRSTKRRDDRHGAARSDVRRSRLAIDRGPLVHRRLRRDRSRRSTRARRRGDAAARNRSDGAPHRRIESGAEDLRRESAGESPSPRTSISAQGSPSPRSRRSRSDLATVVVDVAPAAAIGARDLFVAGASKSKALAVFNRIDAIKVKPDWAMARVGGVTFPKMLAQFEVWAFQQRRRRSARHARRRQPRPGRGGLEHGGVHRDLRRRRRRASSATSMPAPAASFPNIEGPNPERKGQRNNIGDVWIVAKYAADAGDGKPAQHHPSAGASAGDRAAVHAL